jgi:hypothetical protein
MLKEPQTSTTEAPTLNKLFLGLHRTLENELGVARDAIGHSGTLGTVSEDRWINLLSGHLPKRYKVNRAFVIDSRGGCSEQIDAVIHDRQYSPFVLNLNGALYVPAESVYAVLEVKQNMDAGQIEYAVKKTASVRALHRTSLPIPSAGGDLPAKPLHHIVGGLVALESDWSPPFGEAFHRAIADSDPNGLLDIGCAVRNGMFSVKYSPDGPPEILAEQCETSLSLFLLRLIARLQSMATVPLIDVTAYANNIQRTIL